MTIRSNHHRELSVRTARFWPLVLTAGVFILAGAGLSAWHRAHALLPNSNLAAHHLHGLGGLVPLLSLAPSWSWPVGLGLIALALCLRALFPPTTHLGPRRAENTEPTIVALPVSLVELAPAGRTRRLRAVLWVLGGSALALLMATHGRAVTVGGLCWTCALLVAGRELLLAGKEQNDLETTRLGLQMAPTTMQLVADGNGLRAPQCLLDVGTRQAIGASTHLIIPWTSVRGFRVDAPGRFSGPARYRLTIDGGRSIAIERSAFTPIGERQLLSFARSRLRVPIALRTSV